MILGVIIFVLLLGIAYFHFLQGGLSAAISAFSAVIAVLLAFGYYESVVVMFQPGRMADSAPAMVLIALYALSYITIRVLMDMAVPGNIRMPLWVDRSAAAGFGLIAGLCATGVLAVGAQLMPFGPSVAGFTVLPVTDRLGIAVSAGALGRDVRQDQDLDIMDQLEEPVLDPAQRSSLMIPTDKFVIGLTSAGSDGAFSGKRSFDEMHPNLLLQAFANRLGPDRSGKRVIINTDATKSVDVPQGGVMELPDTTPGADAELTVLRKDKKPLAIPRERDKQLLAIRASFADVAHDDDYLRITPAATPLRLGGETFYPIGVMTKDGAVAVFRIDDQILLDKSADFVYQVDKNALAQATTSGALAPGTFVQFKMLGRVDLSGREVAETWSAGTGTVLWKLASPLGSPAKPAPQTAPQPAPPTAP